MADLSSSAGPKRSDRISESIQKASIILGLGSAGIILREHAIDPTRTREENIKTGRKAANILMKFNFGLGFTISGGVKVLDMTGIPASEYVVAVATSPITWGVLYSR